MFAVPIYRILFYSLIDLVAHGTRADLVQAVYEDIAAVAADREVSGFAFVAGDYVAQIVEGRRRLVSERLARTFQSRLLRATQVVSAGPITDKLFVGWAQRQESDVVDAAELFARHGPSAAFTPGEMTPGALALLLQAVAARSGSPILHEPEELVWDEHFALPQARSA